METLGIPISWEGLGISGLILLTILSLIRGWLLPRNTVEALLKSKDEAIEALKLTNKELLLGQAPLLKLLDTLNKKAETGEDP